MAGRNRAALAILCLALPVAAQVVVQGRILDPGGQPLAGVQVSAVKTGAPGERSTRTDAQGRYRLVGLELFSEYVLTCTRPGFEDGLATLWSNSSQTSRQQDFTLWTLDAYHQRHPGQAQVRPGAAEDLAARDAQGVGARLFNRGQFAQAAEALATACQSLEATLAKAQAPSTRAQAQALLPATRRLWALALVAAVKAGQPTLATALALAEPVLLEALRQDPGDAEAYLALLDLAQLAGDPGAIPRYQAAYQNRNPIVAYNLGVEALNAGNTAQAALQFRAALALDPAAADAHFQLARCEQALGQGQSARDHLRRYLELAPTGPFAAEARDCLADAPR